MEAVVQCLNIRQLEYKGSSQERYRIVLNDVRNLTQAILSPEINHLVHDGILQTGSLLRLKHYSISLLRDGKRFLLLQQLEVLSQYGEHGKIGAPVTLDTRAGDFKQEADVKAQPEGISGGDFYGKPAPQSRAANTGGTFGGAEDSNYPNLRPIEALSLYGSEWTIKARCTHKTEIKTWHNKNGEGKLFSVNLLDESGEIRATGFNAQCDMLYNVFQEGGVYYISGCSVKHAKKQFTNIKNDYELMFEQRTMVEKAQVQDNVPKMLYNFTNLADLQNVEKDTTIDVIGVLEKLGETSQVNSKTTQKPYDKRELTLVDNTQYRVRLTIWGNTATTFDAPLESVIAFKGVKVSDFGGRSLSLLSSGSMTVDPDIEEAFRLKGWYDAEGRQEDFQNYESGGGGAAKEVLTVAAVKDLDPLELSEKMKIFTVKGTIVHVNKTTFSYPACITPDCQKKVTETSPGQWFCEKCDRAHDRAQHRYIMMVNVNDFTGQIGLSCFDDAGKIIMGMTADDLVQLKEAGDEPLNEAMAQARYKTYNFRCGAKLDNYNGEQRIRYRILNVDQLKFSTECQRLITAIKKYDIDDGLFVKQ
jgi:replication factor A1